MPGRDLEGDVADQLFEIFSADGFVLARANLDQHADFRAGMNVTGDHAVPAHFHAMMPGDFDVLADFTDLFGPKRFQIGLRIFREPARHFITEGAKRLIACDKIRLAIDLDEHSDPGAGLDEGGVHPLLRLTRSLPAGDGPPQHFFCGYYANTTDRQSR